MYRCSYIDALKYIPVVANMDVTDDIIALLEVSDNIQILLYK
jgi:hypothetical protein